ncbi:MAG: electron transfer flavoprotein subunit alpha/FixB family protein [Anaerolineales bacterium]
MSKDAFVVIEHLQGKVADISYVALAAARKVIEGSDGRVVAVLLGHEARDLAKDLAADEALYVNRPEFHDFTPDAYATALASLIKDRQPKVVLLGNTSVGADVAGQLSISLPMPLVTSCRELKADGKYVCQICGGKILAEGTLPDSGVLLTMTPGAHRADDGRASSAPPITDATVPELAGLKIQLAKYIEPEAADVDIAKESLLIAVGRGIQNQDNISLAEELAQAMGGTVCGSRPVVDQGWLATSRLVGKSGKHVKPKIYLALGISGAPEHAEAITDSDMIIAVNTDPTAPIFDIAKYGAEADMFDVLPPLTEKIRQAEG